MSGFKESLRKMRKRRDMTQAELAHALGLASSTISLYETGAREPDIETLEMIADYFNVDMNYLLGKSPGSTIIPDAYDFDVQEMLEMLHKRPEAKALLSKSEKLTKEQLQSVIALIDTIHKE